MTQRDIDHVLVDIINYDYFWPEHESQNAVFGFTHSREVNRLCRDMLPPHTVTPVSKTDLERALVGYVERRGLEAEDETTIRRWLANLPDNIAIIEREAPRFP